MAPLEDLPEKEATGPHPNTIILSTADIAVLDSLVEFLQLAGFKVTTRYIDP